MFLLPYQDYRKDKFIQSKMTVYDDFYIESSTTCVIKNGDAFSSHFLILNSWYL